MTYREAHRQALEHLGLSPDEIDEVQQINDDMASAKELKDSNRQIPESKVAETVVWMKSHHCLAVHNGAKHSSPIIESLVAEYRARNN